MERPERHDPVPNVAHVEAKWTETMLIKSDDFTRLIQDAYVSIEKTPKDELRGMIVALEHIIDESVTPTSWSLFEAEADQILSGAELANVKGEYQRRIQEIKELSEAMDAKLSE